MCLYSINCRLPQTPRTPGTAASHYFDDVLSRHAKPANGKRNHLRRSSTSRSIGLRSDVVDDAATVQNSVGGDNAADEEGWRKAREEADTHVASYVTSQLERIRTSDFATRDPEDEFEAQLDGQ